MNAREKTVRRDNLRRVREQREDLQKRGLLPSVIDTTRYQQDLAEARAAYGRALDEAAKDYGALRQG